MPQTDIARVVRTHRKRAKLTQEGLAQMAGVGKTAVFDIEHGKETFRFRTLMQILHVLNIKISFSSPIMESLDHDKR
jgi:HTH-type transcriptional regulator/antitoxin HipB